MKGNFKTIIFYIVLIALVFTAVSLFSDKQKKEEVIYSDIVSYFEKEQVSEFKVDSNTIYLKLKDGKELKYKLASVELFINDLRDTIKSQLASGILRKYDYIAYVTPWWMSMLPYLLVVVGFFIFWIFMMNMQGGGGGKAMSFGKAKVRLGADEKHKKTFADVAGADEEKAELNEIVDFLRNPQKYIALGARIPKGVLLVGPPGTGKTLLAKAIAGEGAVPFFSISGSDFVEMFVGVGASRVRDLFDQAKKNSPCIIFIDEIDAVGRHRGAGLGGGHDEREQTLNQLLVEMDGFGANEGIIMIAATNRPDILDPALLRPGRFDRQVYVGVPDIKGREEILRVHSKGKPLESDVNLNTIAKTTVGFSGADLENLLNEAALLAAKENKPKISQYQIENSITKVMMGPEKKSRVITDKEKKLTAYHEAGHAIVIKFLKTLDPVHEISIVPRGMAGGYTLSLPKEDKYYSSKQVMLEEIVSLLGGRVAEILVLDDISTGASNDIERATAIARKMITKYGMSEQLGEIAFGTNHDEVFLGKEVATSRTYSEKTAAAIDEEIKKTIDSCKDKAKAILEKNTETLHECANFLITNERMDAEQFEALFNKIKEEEAKAEEKTEE